MARRAILGALLAASAGIGLTSWWYGGVEAAESIVRYTRDGELIKPDFREWVFLGSGLGMTYAEPEASATGAARPPMFTNVYVNPASYRAFAQTGKWPDQSVFILEIRASASEGSINRGGRYQTELRSIEANVKDSRRPNAWTFYNFGPTADRAQALPTSAPCYSCHGANTAVEHTFVQFYPALLEIAKRKGTLNPSYAAALTAEKAHR